MSFHLIPIRATTSLGFHVRSIRCLLWLVGCAIAVMSCAPPLTESEWVIAAAAAGKGAAVIYDENGAEWGTVPGDTQLYDSGDLVEVLGPSSDDEPGKAGLAFLGWNSADDGSGDHYDEGDGLQLDASSVRLYAEWGLARVVYDGNGQDSGTVPVDPNGYASGDLATVLANTGSLAKDEYTTSGWTLGKGGSVRQAGSWIHIDYSVIRDKVCTLVARYLPHIYTSAGDGGSGSSGDGGNATLASIGYPSGVAVDAAGNLFIADIGNYLIRKVDSGGVISTFAGGGGAAIGDGGLATDATLNQPCAVAVGGDGSVFITDWENNRIRKVDPNGYISTVAGTGEWGFSGDGGLATDAMLNNPDGIAVDASGNLYIADTDNYRIRKVDASGVISTVAGDGTYWNAIDGVRATASSLNVPVDVAVDREGNLYIAEAQGERIRKVDGDGIISTVAGRGEAGFGGDGGQATLAWLDSPTGVAVDVDLRIFIADSINRRIRMVDEDGVITTVAGDGTYGFDGDGDLATDAWFSSLEDVAVDEAGNIYVADYYNHRVRRMPPP